MELIFFLVGVFIGFIIAWLVIKVIRVKSKALSSKEAEELRLEFDKSVTDNKTKNEKIEFLSSEIADYKAELGNKSNEIINLSKELSARNADYKNLQIRLDEQKEEINKLNEKFSIEFKNLANEILDEKTKKFTEQNKENIDEILKPLQEKIKDFEKKVEETNKENIDRHASLRQQLVHLREMNVQMTKEAENLTKALKGDTKSMGNWGEIVLERILENSGLTEGREYEKQVSLINEQGQRLQPDFVVRLPENKNIVIDSKVSLVAYENYVNTTDEQEREKHLKNHVISVTSHIKGLASKNYHELYGLKSLDFVLLFMPVEPAFNMAIQGGENIWYDAFKKNIIIVGPSSLIATLRTIESIWKNEYQNKNVDEIARQAGDLYDKFVGLIEDLLRLGKQIDDTQNTYKASMNKLVDGKGNLIKRAENIKKLGAKTKKTLPDNLLERATDN